MASPRKRERPLASLIVPARNEERHIAQALHSLLFQTYSRKEIIVVNDGSTDRTASIVRHMASKHKGIRPVNFTQGHSAAFARNAGAKAARGTILIFHDADCFADRGYVARIVKHIESGMDGVSNKTLPAPPQTFVARVTAAHRSMLWDTRQKEIVSFDADTPTLIASFRAPVFKKLGGYNEGIFYFEDTDLTRRFVEAHFKALYDPQAIEYHQDPDRLDDVVRQARWFGKGMGKRLRSNGQWRPLLAPLYSFLTSVALGAAIVAEAFNDWPNALVFATAFGFLLLPGLAFALRLAVESKDPVHSFGFLPIFLLRNDVKLVEAARALISG